ncbi:MAG TPA: acyl-CoA dehydrogenase family protein [Conexibacter sp.]|nr:acyl-CoA dehydrogenase family protein [Conexibacter sp.]
MSATADPPVHPDDLLDLEGLLSAEDRAFRDKVRRFVVDRIDPHVAEWFEQGIFPRELAEEMGQLGLLGMHLDGHGRVGSSARHYGIASMELEAGDSAFRTFFSVQGTLSMRSIHEFGSDEQRERWLPEMAAGRAIGCFGLTEPKFGSDPRGLETQARRDGGDWILDGEKTWITNAGFADVAVVWAYADDAIRGFVVPMDTPGVSTREMRDKLSMRVLETSALILEDCRVPASAMLPEARGLRAPFSCLNEARFGIAWGVNGLSRACFEAALAYTKERQQFGKPLAAFQLTQDKLVRMATEINAGLLLAHRLADLADEHDRLTPEQISYGKLRNVEGAALVARLARALLGANGIVKECPIMRHMANMESVATYEGTSEIQTLILGAHLTGLRAFA